MKKIFRSMFLLVVYISIGLIHRTVLGAAISSDAWDHLETPDIFNQNLVIEEDLRMMGDEVIVQTITQGCSVTLDNYVRIKGYKYKRSYIYFQPFNGTDILIDVTEHSLYFKGGSKHHHFRLKKNMGDGIVQFTLGNGHHLTFKPKKD